MNDLDLRAALHRDADLVGEPSPNLLDQLAQRRRHQRHQRTAAFGAVLAVVLIAAGVPVGLAAMTRSSGAPASDPTRSVSTQAPPTTAAPTTAAPTVAVPSPVEPPVVEAPAEASPSCPDVPVLDAALPADTARVIHTLHQAEPVCSGIWAATGYSRTEIIRAGDTLQGFDDQGRPLQYTADADEQWVDESAGLFRYTDGSWTFLHRDDHCGTVTLPDVIWERACNVD